VIVFGTAAAGALGAVARYLIDGFVQDRVADVFPWGTWVVNVTGSLMLGLVTGLVLYHGLGDASKAVIGTGFVGAYTTFSTFTYETLRLVEEGSRYEAALNAATSTAIGLLAAGAGLALAAL